MGDLKLITVSYFKNTFILKCSFNSEALQAKKANWFFDPINRHFMTTSKRIAARFREHFDDSAEKFFQSTTLQVSPWTGRIPVREGKELHQVQFDSAKFCLERNHSYLALEQRIGKTPTAITVLNTLDLELFCSSKTLLIVPPFLVSNWLREIQDWGTRGYTVALIDSGKLKGPLLANHFDILIVPDSIVINEDVQKIVSGFDFDLLIVDEAHRMNNEESQRTQFLYGENGIVKKADKVVLLSGTPMRNRPIDLWPVLSNLAHDTIQYRSKSSYAFKYCDGRVETKEFYKRGKLQKKQTLNAQGSSNEEELQKRLQPFMKVEKYKDHFDISETETLVLLDANKNKTIFELTNDILSKKSLEELVGSSNLGDIATLRKTMSITKMPVARDYIQNALDNTDDKFLVFGFHVDLLEDLYECFKPSGAFLINGKTPMKVRAQIQKDFAEGKTRIGFANIFTMQGIDLSAANRNIFVESSWGPSDNDQAKFRVYGRKQKKSVFTEHLVLAGTLDEYIMRRVLEKKETINKIIRKEVLK